MSDQPDRIAVLQAKLDRLQRLQRWAIKSEDARRIDNMIKLARSEPPVPILHDCLDADPWLFNCDNGTLDLRTGKLRSHQREDYITKLCTVPYRSDADCPLWENTLAKIFNQSAEVVNYVQRVCGYCLTGIVSEQMLLLCWGVGSNGKSLFFEVLRGVMGEDYAATGARELLMSDHHERHPTYLADLFGRRLVTLSETREGGKINEALIKQLTGGDGIKARRMKEDLWEFRPSHKFMIGTNHRPEVRGGDHGIWRRLRLLPFNVKFWDADKGETGPPELKADKGLKDKLLAESPGILAWMVRGCMEWRRGGLREPNEVQVATSTYRNEEDIVGRFLKERCDVGEKKYHVKAGDLYTAFLAWWKESGEQDRPLSQRKFGEELTNTERSRGIERRTSNGTMYDGVRLHEEPKEGGSRCKSS